MAYIKIDEEKRVSAASYDFHCGDGEIEVDIPKEIFIEDIHDYLYIDGEFIYNPRENLIVEELTYYDKIEAQVLYTAIMTDTLMEG